MAVPIGCAGRLAIASAALLLCASPARAAAQTQRAPGPPLDEIEAMADAGRVAEARGALAAWFAAEQETAERHDMVRARFLRARLTPDVDSAEVEYLWVAIDGGTPYGAAAWLRLAQLHLARGEPARAKQELARLRADYPQSELLSESWWWSGRAEETLGDLDAACEAWRRSARADAPVGMGGAEAVTRAAAVREACDRSALSYSVQVGAFRARTRADGVRRQASDRGFEARVERREGLHKVRVGRFSSIESAREMAARLRRAGFSAIIVSGGE